MNIPVTTNAVFKFYSLNQPYKTDDFVSSKEVFYSHGCNYFFPKGGKVIAIFEDPEEPKQEPKICVEIQSLE
jgi:hypothetical protein